MARLALALLVLAGCRPDGPSRAAEDERLSAPNVPPVTSGEPGLARRSLPVAPTRRAAPTCRDPAATYATYAWLPAEVQSIVTVRVHDERLPLSITALEHRTHGPFVAGDPAWTRFAAELPDLRALLATTGLDAPEATFFLAGDIGVWSVPGRCEPDAFAGLVAALGLRERPGGPRVATPASPDRHALVQRAPGGPLWLVRARDLDALLRWLGGLGGPAPHYFGEQLRSEQGRGVVRVYLADWVTHTTKYHLVTGADVQGGASTFCFATVIDEK
jgi:hypothetical protein